jgi:hypothetical protein
VSRGNIEASVDHHLAKGGRWLREGKRMKLDLRETDLAKSVKEDGKIGSCFLADGVELDTVEKITLFGSKSVRRKACGAAGSNGKS